jgi:hypothetical protein
MPSHPTSSSGEKPRVLYFRRRGAGAAHAVAPQPGPPPIEDLARYERGGDDDDYRHRMLINAAALVFVAVLIVAGLWLAETMAELRKKQDCVLSGRRNCSPIEVHRERW